MTKTEKITINISIVDLGQIDLLVSEGFYSSRTDLIRTAIRNQLAQHSRELKEVVTRKDFCLGVLGYGRKDLEEVRKKGQMLEIRVVGMLVLEDDIPVHLALETIKSATVHGVFRASDEVKAALGDRIG